MDSYMQMLRPLCVPNAVMTGIASSMHAPAATSTGPSTSIATSLLPKEPSPASTASHSKQPGPPPTASYSQQPDPPSGNAKAAANEMPKKPSEVGGAATAKMPTKPFEGEGTAAANEIPSKGTANAEEPSKVQMMS